MATLSHLTTVGVERVSGLSGAKGEALVKAGVRNVADLLHVVPRRYIDRSRVEPVALLPVGEEATVLARVALDQHPPAPPGARHGRGPAH